MKIFITHLDNAVSEEKLESLKKDVSYYILRHPEVLKTRFNDDLGLSKDHLKPDRLSFGVSLDVMPSELNNPQQYVHVKTRKPRATREEMSRRIFKSLRWFRL